MVIAAEAAGNIQMGVAWIAEANPEAAAGWYDGLIDAIESLSRMPTRCPLAPESKLGLIDRKVHQLLYGRHFWKYRILFAVEGGQVHIAHVRHGARLYIGQQEKPEEDLGEQ